MATKVVLDLFCAAGGATAGYQAAGFVVVGVDIRPQPHYPGEVFFVDDALDFLARYGGDYDLIHASPPCQRFSAATPVSRRGLWPDLVGPVRDLLIASGRPYVIENVPGAPLRPDVLLCGTMFDLPRVDGGSIARHRVFECSFPVMQPQHPAHPDLVWTITGGGPVNKPSRPGVGGPHRKPTADQARLLMGMPWATKAELNEALPPVYTEWIARGWLPQR